MTGTVQFITSQNPAEAEKLFRSMSHDDLVANCIAAEKMVREHIDRTNEASTNGQAFERMCKRQREFLRRVAGTFDTARLAPRAQRRGIYIQTQSNIRELVDIPLPVVDWPSDAKFIPQKPKPLEVN